MERAFFTITLIFFFFFFIILTAAAAATHPPKSYVADPNYCRGGDISDVDGTYAGYVAHVLAEVATVAPTEPDLHDAAVFPNLQPGSVQGNAWCDGTTVDVGACAACLSNLQQLLYDSCKARAGGGVVEKDDQGTVVCDIDFDVVPA